MTPAVSILTPTFNRHALLKAQHVHVLAQSEQNFEWLILDDGPQASSYFSEISDPRIHYHHLAGPKMRVSAKRNWLCERAKAQIIAQFDDDQVRVVLLDQFGKRIGRQQVFEVDHRRAFFMPLASTASQSRP